MKSSIVILILRSKQYCRIVTVLIRVYLDQCFSTAVLRVARGFQARFVRLSAAFNKTLSLIICVTELVPQ